MEVDKLDQQVDRPARLQRRHQAGDMLAGEAEAQFVEELHGGQELAGAGAQEGADLKCGVEAFERQQRGGAGDRCRIEAQHRAGDDAERALRAAEQPAQLVAGIVLDQRARAVQHAAVGQHDLEPEHQVLHHAVAHRVAAAGIGADQAADLGAAFGAEMEGEHQLLVGEAWHAAPPARRRPRRWR